MANNIKSIRKLRMIMAKSGIHASEVEITRLAVRVAGSVDGYLQKQKNIVKRPLPQMSDTAMQSPKWTDPPSYRRISG